MPKRRSRYLTSRSRGDRKLIKRRGIGDRVEQAEALSIARIFMRTRELRGAAPLPFKWLLLRERYNSGGLKDFAIGCNLSRGTAELPLKRSGMETTALQEISGPPSGTFLDRRNPKSRFSLGAYRYVASSAPDEQIQTHME